MKIVLQLIVRYVFKIVKNDNFTAKHSGDYDWDGIQEVYWKTNHNAAYQRSLMHAYRNIRFSNY